MSTELQWSYGRTRYDVHPTQHQGTLRDLAGFVMARRARSKASAGYLAAPVLQGKSRSREGTAPRNWIALDVDGINETTFVEWRLFLTRYQGIGWPTASSTPERPRERVIITLDKVVCYDDGVRLGALLKQDIEDEFGTAVLIDSSTFRGSQPCFLPLRDARLFYLLGDPLNVAEWLVRSPPPPRSPPPSNEVGAVVADARVRWMLDKLGEAGGLIAPLPNGRGYACRCPWEDSHSTRTSASATAVLFPSDANNWRGAFSCLHSHCAGRTLGDLYEVIVAALQDAEMLPC